MTNVYVIEYVDPTYSFRKTVAIFDNETYAEIKRDQLEAIKEQEEQDRGQYYRITAYELGKVY
jgi:hypothetical protein